MMTASSPSLPATQRGAAWLAVLLVPFVGACIHVPPPPTNQIIYVKMEKGLEITGQFDPVNVVGTLKTETSFTGIADAGYSLDAETVDILKP